MDTEISYNNYGDVALNLPADWDRAMLHYTPMVPLMVGHTNGKADIYREDDPNAPHQFQWVEFGDKLSMSLWRLKGYKYVRMSEGWAIDETLFSWDAENYCINGSGQRAMARPEALYLKDKADLEAQTRKIQGKRSSDEDDEKDLAFARATGAELVDDKGRPLVKRARSRK